MIYDFFNLKKTLISANMDLERSLNIGECVTLTDQCRNRGQYRIVDIMEILDTPGIKYNTVVFVKLEQLFCK